MSTAYEAFLRAKLEFARATGFEVSPSETNPLVKPHQRDVIRWAVAGGRRALFEAFGLGKSIQQIEIARLVRQRAGGRFLQVAPLGVRQEFMRDAALDTSEFRARANELGLDFARVQREYAIEFQFVRHTHEVGGDGFYLTNYESIRDGKLDVSLFSGVSLDEASILRGFGGTKTFRELMRLFEGTSTFRFVATATPSPNEFIELLAYAAFLGIMDVGQAKTRFFKRNSEKADELTLLPSKAREFWLWVSSWAVFLQRPSDLCGCLCHKRNNSAGKHLAGSQSPHGYPEAACGQEHGFVIANAVEPNSPHPNGCSAAALSAAGVYEKSMEAQGLEPIESGSECGIDARDRPTRVGKTMEAGESRCVTAGNHLADSSRTWENPQSTEHWSGETTAGTMSQEIVFWPAANSKLEILDDLSSSLTQDALSRSPHGRKSLGSITGCSTPVKNLDGHPSECSPDKCLQCVELDRGYELPEMEVHWHEIPSAHSQAGIEASGQGRLLRNAAIGVVDAAREKRESLPARIEKLLELRKLDPEAHRVIWHDLEAERRALEESLPTAQTVWGSQDLEEREAIIAAFSAGELQELATKPVIAGSGCNFQRHCWWEIFLGISFKFSDLIQAIHRVNRFLQKQKVRIDLIYTEAERDVRRRLERKWEQHKELTAQMSAIIREYGLATNALHTELQRSFGCERREVAGESFTAVQNDSVIETAAMAADSVHLILTSIPFSTQYEYTPSYNDFGHTDSNEHFWQQMDFLIPELLRVLKPGRVAAVHVKDRIVPGGMTGLGFQTVYPFHSDAIANFTRHGFAFLGMKTIVTDVVRENNQTYRLGWTEQCKDGSRMGAGLPEYLLLFRKPPTDRSNGYADLPVVKDKAKYTRSRWQVDAHGFMRSSGDRLLSAEDLVGVKHDAIFNLFRKHSLSTVYDYEEHVALSESLERCRNCGHIHVGAKSCGVCECSRPGGILPVTFMLLQPQSWHPDVWSDIARMRTLNGAQSAAGREMHLCPMQFDIADRVITRFSMEGETVFDPFMGIGTVPYCAVKLGRRGIGVELSASYFEDAVHYLEAAEMRTEFATLFDLTAEVPAT